MEQRFHFTATEFEVDVLVPTSHVAAGCVFRNNTASIFNVQALHSIITWQLLLTVWRYLVSVNNIYIPVYTSLICAELRPSTRSTPI